jgi:hypothetical protein
MRNKTEQTSATNAIPEIKEQIQIEQWQRDIENRQTADLSIAAFCAQQGISKSTYYYRLRKAREYLCYVSGMRPDIETQRLTLTEGKRDSFPNQILFTRRMVQTISFGFLGKCRILEVE